MSWLKGTRTDGFINIDKNVNFRGTVKGAGDGVMRPKGALDFYVDSVSGSDALHTGKTWDGAFATIQAAITAQIAQTEAKGDNIWVAPGSYAESLTGDLSKVQIRGTTAGSGNAHAVSLRPTASYSYTGSMTDSAFKNIMFMSPSASSKTLPAVLLTYMGYSTIDGCTFIGRDATCVEGLQLGATADGSTVIKCDFSAITNNVFDSFYGTNVTFSYGIKIGTATGSNGAYRQVYNSLIAGNRISARTVGIFLGCAGNKAASSVIRDNFIGYTGGGSGCASYGIAGLEELNRIFVAHNYIKAVDAIYNVHESCTFDNYVSANEAAVVAELPVSA